jgi:hypothetical protein
MSFPPPPMHYEHLVQINDLNDSRVTPLTREQLWQGLVARAERPQYFLIGMDECRISERVGNTMRRAMRFGNRWVCDRVTYAPLVEVRFDVEPTDEIAAAQLIIGIEEPQPGELFLRFTYTLESGCADVVGEADEYRKAAYRQSDVDTARRIRQFVEAGLLSADGTADVELH